MYFKYFFFIIQFVEKFFYLKLAAKTMNFLTEHKIEQYADLVSRIEEISAENEKTADALKSVEKRLADMAVLMKHVATYQKTKPVYEAYGLDEPFFSQQWRKPGIDLEFIVPDGETGAGPIVMLDIDNLDSLFAGSSD